MLYDTGTSSFDFTQSYFVDEHAMKSHYKTPKHTSREITRVTRDCRIWQSGTNVQINKDNVVHSTG